MDTNRFSTGVGKEKMKYDAIVFDLDGTLIDSAPDLVNTLNDLLLYYGRPVQTLAALRPYVSYGSTKLMEIGFDNDYPKAFAELRQDFLTHYKKQNTDNVAFFDGMETLLAAIEKSNTPWGIMTNKPTDCTLAIAQALALDKRAQAIVCGDTLPVSKPDPSPIILACKMMGVDSKRCVYIGDCRRDMTAGKLAEMDTIACQYGYVGPNDDMTSWQADYIAKTPMDILSFIRA